MKTLELVKATAPLAEYAAEVQAGPVVLTKHGEPVALLVAVKDVDLETLSLSTSPQFQAIIEQSRERQQREGGIPAGEMRRRLGLEKPKKRSRQTG